MKDRFSSQSENYAQFRPTYPADCLSYINSICPIKKTAWDCGTGNGQIACELAKSFEHVCATDISPEQLAHARPSINIDYSVQPAEQTDFMDQTFDLITVGQAIHWFDFEKFYREVYRVAKIGAIMCVLGYGRIRVSDPIDEILDDFYGNVIGPYWDEERKHIDDDYQKISFPFEEIKVPAFCKIDYWSKANYLGYLNTWSAVRKYIQEKGINPLEQLEDSISGHWGRDEVRKIRFPILFRAGKLIGELKVEEKPHNQSN